jgi:hypothetical protein
MRLAGRRFWTWMGVAVISFFVKSGSAAIAQEKTGKTDPLATSQGKHNVPRRVYAKTGQSLNKQKVTSGPAPYSIGKGEQKKWLGQEGAVSPKSMEKVGADHIVHKSDLAAPTAPKLRRKRAH